MSVQRMRELLQQRADYQPLKYRTETREEFEVRQEDWRTARRQMQEEAAQEQQRADNVRPPAVGVRDVEIAREILNNNNIPADYFGYEAQPVYRWPNVHGQDGGGHVAPRPYPFQVGGADPIARQPAVEAPVHLAVDVMGACCGARVIRNFRCGAEAARADVRTILRINPMQGAFFVNINANQIENYGPMLEAEGFEVVVDNWYNPNSGNRVSTYCFVRAD